MSDADRIDRLERRLLSLEEQLRELAGQGGREAAGYGASTRAGGEVSQEEPKPAPSPNAGPASNVQTYKPTRSPSSPLSSEQWIGQRLLLAIGVVALILAAGYLLRLSFDRGWISPVMRCVGGTVAGIFVGAVGWRLQPRYRTYGAALIGCGAAIIYLCVWAAARLYEVLPPTSGIVGLALVSVALAMIAYAIDVEALGTTAALGAFFAPLLLGRDSTHADMLLLYLASMAVGLGWVAARRRWRQAMAVVAISFFGVAYVGAVDRGIPWAVLVYGVVGGSVGIHIGLRERWWETRLLSFTGGWTLLGAASHRLGHPLAVLVAAIILAAPVWLHGLRSDRVPPRWRRSGEAGWSPGEAFYFFVTPLLLGWAVHGLSPRWFDREPGAVALAVAVPYLIAGYQKPRPAFALIGAAALGLAAWLHWDGVARVGVLLGLAILWASLDHPLTRTDGRWYALGTLWASLDHQFGGAELSRKASDPAFVGSWALALWGLAVGTAALAAGLWRRAGETSATQLIRGGLWALSGGLVLFGVTGEIQRYFALRTLSAETASLASGLAVSAWWLIFAAALIAVGFRRGLKPVRVAGLGVAGLAVVKVLVFDLSSLDALYRVGSVFILGLVFLLLAYLYHRQGRATEGRGAESVP
jgi:uncharacterized membrane protein